MAIKPVEIKIYLSTHIPGQKENYKYLSKSMLSTPEIDDKEKKSKESNREGLPYFTNQVEYPESLRSLPYKDIISFFFDKKEFTKKLVDY
jgi:hypothetical protein